jgi:flagellar basal-body rod protein FlgC
MNVFGMLEMSGAALGVERFRAQIAAANMANAESTRTEEGGPYRRKQVVLGMTGAPTFRSAMDEVSGSQVRVVELRDDESDPLLRYDPSHPDAKKDGYVEYPNINPVVEMADLLGAARSFQLNIAAVNAAKSMAQQSLEILK